MKFFYALIFLLSLHFISFSQDVIVSGECITSPVSLASAGTVDGKPAYQGVGTVDGIPGVTVSVYWIGAPDNVWVLDFDGQPFFMNACNTTNPVGTESSACPWSEVTSGACTGGAALSISGSEVLPVRYISFTATESGGKVMLQWKTAEEMNNKGFAVERSSDGNNWTSIGFVSGSGSTSTESTYHFTDQAPADGRNFYRLVQEDHNGSKSYSVIVSADIANTNPISYRVSNNPGNGIYQMTLKSPSPVKLSVHDLTGRLLLQKTAASGVHRLDLSSYTRGVYLLQIKMNSQIFTTKLIKQ